MKKSIELVLLVLYASGIAKRLTKIETCWTLSYASNMHTLPCSNYILTSKDGISTQSFGFCFWRFRSVDYTNAFFLHKPTFTPIGFQMAKIQHFFYSEVFFWCQKDKVRKIIFLLIGIQQKSISKTIECLGVAQSLVVIFNSQAIEHFSILGFYSIVHFVRRKRVFGKGI